jgi:hypothetical protein
MSALITGEEFGQLFQTFERSAWRLETQFVYREPKEVPLLRAWRAGERDDLAWMRGWLDNIRAIRRAGKDFGRVRVLSEPLTDYLQWQMTITPANVEAGEDIRLLAASRARELGLPTHDFWLFDDERVALMHFGEAGFIGAEIVTDLGTVARHRAWRDTAVGNAVPYSAADPSLIT